MPTGQDVAPEDSRHWEGGQCQVTKSPYVYMLFYAAYLAIEPVTRLPFWVCSVVEWRRAYHLTLNYYIGTTIID